MKSIQEVIGKNQDQKDAIEAVLKQIEQSKILQPYILKFNLNTDEIIQNSLTLIRFDAYVKAKAEGIDLSGNTNLEGYLSIDSYRRIEFSYRYNEKYEKLLKIREYVTCWHLDEHMLDAAMKDFIADKDSPAVRLAMVMVAQSIRKDKMPIRGLFISGANGVGKTHMLAAIAKEFYTKKKRTTIVFFPELIRDLKQNPFGADKVVRHLQKTPILMIDDIGSEMQTSFSRDEILLPVLNARMNNRMITFFTSNLDMAGLEHHFTQSQYGENEPIKAKRIIERILALSDFSPMLGDNKRQK